MTDPTRTIDPARQGGNAAPKAMPKPAEPMSADGALAFVAARPRDEFAGTIYEDMALTAARALAAEVERLRAKLAGYGELERRESAAWRNAYRTASDNLTRFRAALPEVIGCNQGKGVGCAGESQSDCCYILSRMIRAGLLPPPEAQTQGDVT